MRQDIQNKYLYLFKSGESLTQKEVAAQLKVSIASASKNLRNLYERGLLNTDARPGMSLRYSAKKDFEVIRTMNGNPLYHLYDISFKEESASDHINAYIKSLVSNFIDGDVTPDDIRNDTLEALRALSQLFEILASATPGQIKATRQALIESQGSPE